MRNTFMINSLELSWLGKVHFTPGFLFCAALLLYRSTSIFLVTFLLAAMFHELAHVFMARLLHIPLRNLSMTAFGCVLSLADSALIPNWKLLLIATAGPLANLSLTLLSLNLSEFFQLAPLFGAENLLLALFNLLPIFPLDGAVIISAALSAKLLPQQAERCVHALSLLLVAATVVSVLLLRGTARLRVALFALWLTIGLVQKIRRRPCHFSFFRLKLKT